jgi:hypothetical protein
MTDELNSRRRRRPRKSIEVNRRLALARQRNLEQLAEQRRREQEVMDAVATFITTAGEIDLAQEGCAERIAPLRNRIDNLTEQLRQQVAEMQDRQRQATLAIHRAGRSIPQITELLGLPEPDVRRLVASSAKPNKSPRTQEQRSAHQAEIE